MESYTQIAKTKTGEVFPGYNKFIASPAPFIIATGLWVITILVIGAVVLHKPYSNTVTLPYHLASNAWWKGGSLYMGPIGMNYLPHFAIIFSLFRLAPLPWSEILWRWLAIALISTGLWRFSRQVFGDSKKVCFLFGTVLILPLSLAAFRNGQANAVFGGLILHGIVSLASKKWWQAAGLIALSVAIKPLGVVLVLLAPVVYGPLRWKMIVAMAALFAFPFLFARPGYVLDQYHAFVTNLQSCAVVNDHSYADVGGIFRTFHIELPPLVSKIMRVSAGGLTLALWWWGARLLREPLRTIWLLALTAGYLMLFNPMNEANSYVICVPAFALWAIYFLKEKGFRGVGWSIVAIIASMSLGPTILRPWLGSEFALFWHPFVTIIFLGLLIFQVNALKDHEVQTSTMIGSAGK